MDKDAFVGETFKRLILVTGLNFEDDYTISSCAIVIMDARGSTQEFEASILTGEESQGSIFIDFSEDVSDEEPGIYFTRGGEHKARAVLTHSDGRRSFGAWVRIKVGG